jgi:hypothetical protein
MARNVGGTPKKKWSPDEDAALIAAVSDAGPAHWPHIAQRIPGRTGKQCRERWVDNLSPDLLRDDWSADEDMILIMRQSEFGNAWAKIRSFLPGRSIGGIKNRWSWLSRKDIPNHAGEFNLIAKTLGEKVAKKQADVWDDFELFDWDLC